MSKSQKNQPQDGEHFPAEEYFPIRVNSLHPSEPIPFDVYVMINHKPVKYLHAGDGLTAEKIHKFELKANDSFCIQTKDRHLYRQYIQGRLNSEKVSPQDKALILRESSLAIVQDLFESPDIGAALAGAKDVVTGFLDFMEENRGAMGELLGLSRHDFYTYNHSVDVSIYSIGLGSVLGYTGEDLQRLGEGALFHDIGKRNVDINIITKDGPLDDSEWEQMRMHPDYGLLILNEQEDVNEDIKACCFEHHESFLGNGYPLGLQGQQIHPMARIISVTDTFDALTTKRSYNEPMTPKDALNFMKSKLHARYDKEVMEAMFSVLFKMSQKVAS